MLNIKDVVLTEEQLKIINELSKVIDVYIEYRFKPTFEITISGYGDVSASCGNNVNKVFKSFVKDAVTYIRNKKSLSIKNMENQQTSITNMYKVISFLEDNVK